MKLPVRIIRPPATSLPLERAEVMRFLGYQQGKTLLTPAVDAILDRGIALALEAARPAATMAYCSVKAVTAGSIALAIPGLSWRSTGLAKVLRHAEAVTIAAATLGLELEETVQKLFAEQDYATATVVDAAGSALVQSLTRHIEGLVGEAAGARSLKATTLFSPGYADWDIFDQQSMADQAGGAAIGVRCTSTCYLLPQKSMLGVVGWVADGARLPASGCEGCGLTSCAYRRVIAR